MLLTFVLAAALTGFGVQPARPDSIPVAAARKHRGLAGLHRHAADSLDVSLYARVLQTADQRVLDTAVITSALASPNAELRRVAARTLSQVALRHRRRAIPLMLQLVRDADSSVAGSAIFGLGLVRDTAAVPLLASRLRVSSATGAAAAWSLGEIGAPAADTVAALLAEALKSAHAPRETTVALLLAASKARPLSFAAVAPYIDSKDAELRWAAAYAVARQHARAGARALLAAGAPDAAFRAELARELTSQVAGDSLHDRALARLRVLANDEDAHVRINALHSIASFGETSRSVVLHAMRDRDANVRVAAAQSAATAFGADSSAWREAWSADSALKTRKSLLESGASAGFYFPEDSTWLGATDWTLREAAMQAWASARDTTRARDAAIQMTHDADARVRGAAYNLLVASDSAHRDTLVQRVLLAARTDPDSIVRSSIPGARARSVDTAAVDRPIEWYADVVRSIVIPALRGHSPRAVMSTTRGRLVITLDAVQAPLTTLNYVTLAQKHFYDGLRFHRVVPGFVAQDGDPRGDGEGGPGYAIRDELTLLPYARGTVGMALSGPDTGGSQYFLTLAPQPHLTGHYTVFGRVTSGTDVMDSLVEGDAINSVVIH